MAKKVQYKNLKRIKMANRYEKKKRIKKDYNE